MPARQVGMNSAISYLSAAQLQADAVAASYRNPRPRLEPAHPVREPKRRPVLLRFRLLALAHA